MLLPERMAKVLVTGSKDRLRDTIDVLYSVSLVHPIDFLGEEEGFTIGAPFPDASDASQKLLKLRSIEKELDIVDAKVESRLSVEQIRKDIDETIIFLEAEISGAVESKNRINERIQELEVEKRGLEPLLSIPLDLEFYSDYTNITVFTGTVRTDPESALKKSVDRVEVFKAAGGSFVAVFVAKKEASEAQRILIQNGFTDVPLSKGKGSPDQVIKGIDEEEAALKKVFSEAEDKLSELRKKNQAFVLASEEQFSIDVEKAEFPLRIATTSRAFFAEGWIPAAQTDKVKAALAEKMGDNVFLEVVEVKNRKEPHGEHEADEEEVPVRTSEKRPLSLFSSFVELISTPKYNEIDPAMIIAITFPLFFGLMVGDVAYGILFMALGWLGLKKVRTDDWRMISTMLFFGGVWATIFGVFLFGEAFGLHFARQITGGTEELSWSFLLNMDLPHSIDLAGISIPLGVFSKLHDVNKLLLISVWIGIAHLFIGLGLGFANVAMRSGFVHAIKEKFSWVLILFGVALILPYMLAHLDNIMAMDFTSTAVLVPLAFVIIGIVLAIIGEGGTAILELPGLASNILSYTRLTAIGTSKAGLALAFNMIALEMLAPAGGAMLIFGIVIFMVGHLAVFILAVISAGMHGIRLHYVELFGKFYKGGGLKFSPLKIVRKYTSER